MATLEDTQQSPERQCTDAKSNVKVSRGHRSTVNFFLSVVVRVKKKTSILRVHFRLIPRASAAPDRRHGGYNHFFAAGPTFAADDGFPAVDPPPATALARVDFAGGAGAGFAAGGWVEDFELFAGEVGAGGEALTGAAAGGAIFRGDAGPRRFKSSISHTATARANANALA
jgi:hypothetical protein